ncbi:MAG: hypothetical protein ABW034_11055 [Steroidobacteraceae bacterium]
MLIRTTIAAVIAVAALTTLAFAAKPNPEPLLLTQDQQEVDALALSLRDAPAVKAARAEALERWQQLRSASTKDGKATVQGAVDEAVYATLRATAANDPANPRVIWTVAPPYDNGGEQVPGSRVGGDSPDRIYRAFAVDPKYTYEIHGQRRAKPSLAEFTFEAWPLPLIIGYPQATLTSKDIDVGADGRFVVTLDTQPTNGRRNHLQLLPGTATIFLRDTLSDWSSQLPNELVVKRAGGPDATPRDSAAVVKQAAEQIRATATDTIKFIDWAWKDPANQITPLVRPQEWGVQGAVVSVNRFSIKNDEALVITVDRIGAKYIGFQLTDPWLRSVDYWAHNSSLSDRQAKATADGTFTYVIAPRDPGVHNWLDTGGLNDGDVLVRWEGISGKPAVEKAVRSARLVKLTELSAALPPNTPRVDPSERKRLLAARTAEYRVRVAQQ